MVLENQLIALYWLHVMFQIKVALRKENCNLQSCKRYVKFIEILASLPPELHDVMV